jgi:HPt (histidine-containing phosphotransfer) domain-containing protein
MSSKLDGDSGPALPAVKGSELLIWDVTTLARMFGDDQPMSHRMLEAFVREALVQVAAIELAAAAGEFGNAADLAHMLKTSARMVGALRMGQLCEEIESCGLDQAAPACRAAVSGLAAAFASVRGEIRPRSCAQVRPFAPLMGTSL